MSEGAESNTLSTPVDPWLPNESTEEVPEVAVIRPGVPISGVDVQPYEAPAAASSAQEAATPVVEKSDPNRLKRWVRNLTTGITMAAVGVLGAVVGPKVLSGDGG